MGASRKPWHNFGRYLRRPWLVLGVVVGVAAVGYLAKPYYQAHRELTEARRLIDDLELKEAKNLLERYLQTWPKDGEAHLLLARTDRMLGLFPTAFAHLRQAESMAGSPSAITLEKLLLNAEQTGEISSATSILQSYLDSNAPEAPQVLQALSMGAFRARHYLAAGRWLQFWTENFPSDWRGHLIRGMLFRNQGNWSGAEQELEQVLALKPSYAEAHHWLGICLVRSGYDYSKGIQHLEIYLRTAPSSSTALTALGQAQLALNQREAAAATVARLLEQEGQHTWGLLLRAQIQLDDGAADQALATLGRVGITNSSDPRERGMLLSLRAKVLRLMGRVAEAESCERQFRALDDDLRQLAAAMGKLTNPGDEVPVQRKIGLIYLHLGDYEEAQHWFDAVLRAKPDDKIVKQALDDYRRQHFEPPPPDRER